MATIIEVKYFNSFLLKKTMPSDQNVAPVWNGSTGVPVTNPTSGGYPVAQPTDQNYSWFVEESRIRGGYNNTNTDYGVRAYIVDNEADGSIREIGRASCRERV